MSVFQKICVFPFIFLSFSLNTRAEPPRIGSPYAQMRTKPLFAAPFLKLAKTWGPTVPINTEFRVEKAYGRWLYGTPKPLAKMKAKDFSPKGWVFSRQLLAPGDTNVLSKQNNDLIFSAIQRTEVLKKSLGLEANSELLKINFLESLVLSQKTLTLFIQTDEQNVSYNPISKFFSTFIPAAFAKNGSSLGLTGPSLEFLDFEIHAIEKAKKDKEKKIQSNILKAPSLQPINRKIFSKILSRTLLAKEYTIPPLTQEEVDGHSYMNAIAHRVLKGCKKEIQTYWQALPFRFFRVFKNKNDSSENRWVTDRLGGGYFAISAFSIDTLSNEAELAFLLVRLLIQSVENQPKEVPFLKKQWQKTLKTSLEKQKGFLEKNNNYSTMKNYDVGNESYIDKMAIDCLRSSGYSYLSAINFLTRLKKNKNNAQFHGFWKTGIGYDYRLDKLKELQSTLSQEHNTKSLVSNTKRFSRAVKNWNLLP